MQNQIPKGWHIEKLGNITQLITKGTTPTTIGRSFIENGINFIKAESISDDGHFQIEKFDHIDEKTNSMLKRSIIITDDILYSIAGIIGRTALVTSKELPANTNQALAIIRPKTSSVNPKYLYYFLSRRSQKQLANSYVAQSVQKNINLQQVGNFNVLLPPMQSQRKIASILSVFDDKIEINNKIAKTLEEMAQTIFKEWFINFKFPGHEKVKMVESDLGKIPERWEVKTLPEVAKVVDCLHIKLPKRRQEGKVLLNVFNIGRNGLLETGEFYYISTSDYKIWSKNIELKGSDLVITNAGRVGAVGIIPDGFSASAGRNMTAVRAEKIPPVFLFDYLFSPPGKQEVKYHTDFSTVFASLNVRGIKKFKMIIPSDMILKKYESISSPLLAKRERIKEENHKLTEMRDLLLSKLMKGEVRI